MDVRLGTGIGGKSFVILSGDVAAVHEAVEAGIRTASENGLFLQKSYATVVKREYAPCKI